MSNQCVVCLKDSSQSCSLCNLAFYCSREHQKSDWKNHKVICAPFKIQNDERLGRHLVATRDIKQGEIIMKKYPLVLAPKMASFPLCLGCHKRIQDFHKCSKCGWPLCSESCEESDPHIAECEFFKSTKYPSQIQNTNTRQGSYSLFAPLRSILLKSSNPKKFETLMSMQTHLQENINTPIYKYLRLNLTCFQNYVSEPIDVEECLTICSIFDTNSFEIRDMNGSINIRGVYPIISLIAHDCKTNTKHSFHGEEHEMHVTATTDIKKGELLTLTYTQTLWGTLSRRLHLKQAKNFDCVCNRCSDPREFGTCAGSIYCPDCSNQSSMMFSLDPLDSQADWECESCGHLIHASDMRMINENFRREICQIDKSDPGNLEDFLERSQEDLHPTNCHILEVKYALTQLYRNVEELPEELLMRKVELCKDLLAVSEILEPGCTRFRGNLLHDIFEATFESGKRNFAQNKINEIEANEVFKKSLKILEEAAVIYQNEPDMEQTLSENFECVLKLVK